MSRTAVEKFPRWRGSIFTSWVIASFDDNRHPIDLEAVVDLSNLLNTRTLDYNRRRRLLEGLQMAALSAPGPLLLRQVASGGNLIGKDHPHHRSIRPVVLVELIPRHHHRRLPGRFRHGCTPCTRSRRNARSLRLSASIRRHSSAAAPCSIRRRRQAGMGPPARCGGCRPPAPLALPRLSHPNIPRVAPVACPHDCLTTLWPAGADFRARETASLRGQLHGCSFNIEVKVGMACAER